MKNIHPIVPAVFVPTASQKRAREIMGRNILGVEEAIEYFGVDPSKEQLAALSGIQFSEEDMLKRKYGHILVADTMLSMLDIGNKIRKKIGDDVWHNWNNEEGFARVCSGEAKWYLVNKEPVINSTLKTWAEQLKLLGKDEGVPTARLMICTIIGHYLATGEMLFKDDYVLCSDVSSMGCHIGVGYFDGHHLRIGHFRDSDYGPSVGLASFLRK